MPGVEMGDDEETRAALPGQVEVSSGSLYEAKASGRNRSVLRRLDPAGDELASPAGT